MVWAVDAFGRGFVGTGLADGFELIKPHEFIDGRDVLDVTLSAREGLASSSVTTI